MGLQCSSDIDGFCNGGELPGMVQIGSMSYFQDHKWYNELMDEKLKDETLTLKTKGQGLHTAILRLRDAYCNLYTILEDPLSRDPRGVAVAWDRSRACLEGVMSKDNGGAERSKRGK
ncbi:hypothetical protein Tco_0671076 [Tanacetum coccineum]